MIEKIEVLTHSSIRIQTDAGVVYIDPFQLREADHDADFILVTHDHHDHFSPEDIAKVQKNSTILVAPEKMEAKAKTAVAPEGQLFLVKPNGTYEIAGLKLETVPAYNKLKPFHPKGAEWVGYLVISDGKRIYIAGDTDLTKENQLVQCDIALVPVGGTYTMDAKKAAELVNLLKPEIAVPTHYGSIVGEEKDAEIFCKNVKEPVKTVIKKRY